MSTRPIVGGDLDDAIPPTRIPHDLRVWLEEECDRRCVGRGILVSVALARLRADLALFGDVDPLLRGPRTPTWYCLGCGARWVGDDCACTCVDGDPRYEEWHLLDPFLA